MFSICKKIAFHTVTISLFAAMAPLLHHGPFPSPFFYSENYTYFRPDNLDLTINQSWFLSEDTACNAQNFHFSVELKFLPEF